MRSREGLRPTRKERDIEEASNRVQYGKENAYVEWLNEKNKSWEEERKNWSKASPSQRKNETSIRSCCPFLVRLSCARMWNRLALRLSLHPRHLGVRVERCGLGLEDSPATCMDEILPLAG